ncbi:UNVERIFIED_CONTAM: hypothetical protein Sangu_2423600 [Sesamum angustifolium]|uniref:RNase H type-1 domain-containing protein n=1 Tax=Sesamum angustifolium TaxID=2727405 RepID=A0AAW2KY16_9LAMI
MDGSSQIQGNGVGVVVTSPHGEDLEFSVKFDFKASNNEKEYEALLIGMKMAHEAGAKHPQIVKLKTSFESFQFTQIPKEENIKADRLSKLASSLENCRMKHITIQYLPNPRAPLVIQVVSYVEDWRTALVTARFLLQGGILYKKSLHTPPIRCLSQQEGLHSSKIADVVELTGELGY